MRKKLKEFLNNYRKQVIVFGVFLLFLVIFFIGKSFAVLTPIKSIIITSKNTNYEEKEPGSVYTLREVKAPTGYQLLGETLTVKVDSDGNVTIDGYNVDNKDGTATVSIANKKINVLPNTGGIGIIPYIFVGLLLVIGGVVCCVKMIRKGGDEHEKSNH